MSETAQNRPRLTKSCALRTCWRIVGSGAVRCKALGTEIVIEPLEIKNGQVFVKLEPVASGSPPSLTMRVSARRCHTACIYYRKPYSNQKTWKRTKKSWFFEEMSPEASPETLSVTRECCLRHFWWKIFSSFSQLLFWTVIFAWFHRKIQWFP